MLAVLCRGASLAEAASVRQKQPPAAAATPPPASYYSRCFQRPKIRLFVLLQPFLDRGRRFGRQAARARHLRGPRVELERLAEVFPVVLAQALLAPLLALLLGAAQQLWVER
jgi:hypothetical protein